MYPFPQRKKKLKGIVASMEARFYLVKFIGICDSTNAPMNLSIMTFSTSTTALPWGQLSWPYAGGKVSKSPWKKGLLVGRLVDNEGQNPHHDNPLRYQPFPRSKSHPCLQ
jgi:hypothetical protein